MGRVALEEAPAAEIDAVEVARLRHAVGQLSCLAASYDKHHAHLRNGAVVAYRVAAGVCVVAGDPLASDADAPRAIAEFTAACRAQRRAVCFMQTRPSLRGAYRDAGLRVLGFGEEPMVDLPGFDLAAPRRANLRHELARAARAGLRAEVLPWGEAGAATWAELRPVSDAWLRARPWPELWFSVGRFGDTLDPGGLLTVVRDAQGVAQAFTTWLRLGESGLALDMFRRRPGAPPGAMDLCITATLERARERGLAVASLGIAPFRESPANAHQRAGGRVANGVRGALFRHGTLGYDYRSLSRFKDKFAPRWEPRDVAVSRGPRALAIPVALAVVHFRAPRVDQNQRGRRVH